MRTRPHILSSAAWALGGLGALLLAAYRGLRAPNLWSACYYQVSWLDGYARRGLLGVLLAPFGCWRFDPWNIRALQLGVLLLALAALAWLATGGRRAGILLFFAGSGGAFFFHSVGYPEQAILLLGVAAADQLRRGRDLSAGLLCASAVLVHELSLFSLLPALMLLALWLGRKPWRLLLPSAGAALFLLLAPTPGLPQAQAYVLRAATCGQPVPRMDYLSYQGDSVAAGLRCYYSSSQLWSGLLPLALALGLWVLSGAARPAEPPRLRWALWATCLAPLLLGWLGSDTGRWMELSLLLSSLLAAPAGRAWTWRRVLLGLPLALLLLTLPLAYFDGYAPRPLSAAGLRGFPAQLEAEFSRLPAR
jgi:hypothetical protein